MYEGAAELDKVISDIEILYKKKEELIRRFVLRNQNLPVNEFFVALYTHAGISASLRWYMKAYGVGILKAKRELHALLFGNEVTR